MTGRWRDPAAFRAAPTTAPVRRPTPRQSVVLLIVLALVAGTVAAVSYLVRPDRARSFDLFHGSLFLADSLAPVAVDLASGRPTVRLVDAAAQVGATNSANLSVVPLQQGTLLLDRDTGEFNMVADTGFVVKHGGGVPLASRPGATGAVGIASGQLAFIEQTGPTGTSVYLVGQSTVETASNVRAKVQPRAFRSMPQTSSIAPGAAASANGELWTLLGSGNSRTVRELRVPAGSSAGARLRAIDHGTVAGAAALESATVGGATGSMVGLASADRVRIFQRGAATTTVRYPAIAGADQVLPVSNASDRLSYLVHGTAGWSVVSVGADGSGLRGPTRLADVGASAALAPPAASRGALYSIDTGTGRLLRIGTGGTGGAAGRTSGIAGVDSYPLAAQRGRIVEPGGFGDAYAVARGPRVIINSPGHLNALVVFTDGSHPPMTIEKSSAVTVDAASGAEALTRSRTDTKNAPRTPSADTPKTTPKQQTPVNNKINCRTANQKPHIPSIVGAQTGSRTVLLTWTYPLLGRQDCVPSTYAIGIQALSSSAPAPPSTVRVQGQQSVNIAGLFPATQYSLTVTAYINGIGTASRPQRVTTGPEGPAAPKNVTASTDSGGDWNITWSSCGGIAKGCVAASSWQVIPEFCDGRGLSGAPAPITVTADPTSTVQPPAQLRGGDALLGRGLRFQVEGTGTQGNVGNPSAYTACSYSWSPPVASALQLNASQPATTSLGGSASTSVTLDLGANAVHDVGGAGATVTFTLAGGGQTRTKQLNVSGESANVAVSFPGVQAGATYFAGATVSPPGHPGSAVTVSPVSVRTRADWPALSATASCPGTGTFSCTLSVQVAGLSSRAANGERFDLTSSSRIQCGNAGQDLTKTGFDPSQDTITTTLSQLDGYYGTCKVTVALVEHGGGDAPLVFGGTISPSATTDVDLGSAASSGAGQGDFQVSWTSQGGGAAAHFHYTGRDRLATLTKNWSETVSPPSSSQQCGSASQQPDTDVRVDPTCVDDYGDKNNWTATISYQDTSDGTTHGPFIYVIQDTPPGYQACAPTGFAASYGATKLQGINVTFDQSSLTAGCSGWSYTVLDGNGNQVCNGVPAVPGGPPPVSISLATCGLPTATNWQVRIGWTDTAGRNQSTTIPIPGDQPTT